MKLLNYFLDNVNKYYQYLDNPLINNISQFELNECNHINLYGVEGSAKEYYVYYIINQLINNNITHNSIKIHKNTINVNNNTVEFNVHIHDAFHELNLFNRSNYDKHIISKYIVEIIKIRNYKYPKHIILLKNF